MVAPFQAPLGVDRAGSPRWIDLHDESSRHLMVVGGNRAGRAEVVRSVAIGVALTTRPACLQILAIDSTGRELSVLETLPHAVAETATDPASARLSLLWLAAELEARMREGRRWPDMLLAIDDIGFLAASDSGRGRSAASAILRAGGPWGIHLLGGAEAFSGGLRSAGWGRGDVARLTSVDPPGWYGYGAGPRCERLMGVRMAAADLNLVAQGDRLFGRRRG